jgi:hypothetical protein
LVLRSRSVRGEAVNRDITGADMARAGVCLRMRPMKPRDGWMFEGVAAVARRAIGVAIVRKFSRTKGAKK